VFDLEHTFSAIINIHTPIPFSPSSVRSTHLPNHIFLFPPRFSLLHIPAVLLLTTHSQTLMGGNSPCASCKLLRRRCAKDCIFSPYFPSEDPHKFAIVHKVFGASNVSKMLQVCLSLSLSLSLSCTHTVIDLKLMPTFASPESTMKLFFRKF
jgi:hypothetical protein